MVEAANSDIWFRKNTLRFRYTLDLSRQAVKELGHDGIFTYCISLDPNADKYVSAIFGRKCTVIDNIQRLMPAA